MLRVDAIWTHRVKNAAAMTAASNAANVPVPSSIENERRAHEPSMEEILASIRKIIADDDALPLSRSAAPPRLFETNVTPFAPQPQPSAAREAPAAVAQEPVAQELVAREPVAEAPVVEAPVAETPTRAGVRLDAAEMESFAEVGRELARLDDPADLAGEAEQDNALRPALDAAGEAVAEIHAPHEVEADSAPDERVRAEADMEDVQDERVLAPEFPPVAEAGEEQAFAAGFETTGRFEAKGMLSTEANASVASAFQALSASVQMASAEAIDRHVRDMLRPMLKQWLDDNLPVMVERLVRAEIERVARGGR